MTVELSISITTGSDYTSAATKLADTMNYDDYDFSIEIRSEQGAGVQYFDGTGAAFKRFDIRQDMITFTVPKSINDGWGFSSGYYEVKATTKDSNNTTIDDYVVVRGAATIVNSFGSSAITQHLVDVV